IKQRDRLVAVLHRVPRSPAVRPVHQLSQYREPVGVSALIEQLGDAEDASKMGDRYLRRLLVVGATSVVRRADTIPSATGAWVRSLVERKPNRLATVAMANKTARIAWAVLARSETYRAPAMT
ncbi:MAG: hypothetical protein AAF583_00905, partial [Pseudomonadota bacterium]